MDPAKGNIVYIVSFTALPECLFVIHHSYSCRFVLGKVHRSASPLSPFYTAQGRAPHAAPYFYPCPRRGPRAYPHAPRTAPMLVRMQGSRPSSAPAARIAPRAPLPFLWVGCAPGLAPTERGPEADSSLKATLTTKAVVHSDDTFVEVVVLSLPFLSTALHLSQRILSRSGT